MQFIIIARDYKDALETRLKVRDQHIARGEVLIESGNYHMGIGLLDDKGNMCGSVMAVEFDSRKELNEWLEKEPYILNNVWETWEVTECKIGPTFLK